MTEESQPLAKTGTMTKADIVERIYEKVGFSKKEASEVVESIFEIIKARLEHGDKVKISGFGNFVVNQKRPRKGRNPQTGEEIIQNTPPACLAEGATSQPTAPVAGTGRPSSDTPGSGSSDGDDNDPSVLTLTLITIGIVAAGAIVAVIAFVIRRRVGYEPHAPSDGSGESGGDQH